MESNPMTPATAEPAVAPAAAPAPVSSAATTSAATSSAGSTSASHIGGSTVAPPAAPPSLLSQLRPRFRLTDVLLTLTGFVVLYFVWDIGVRYLGGGKLLPPPAEVFQRLFQSFVTPIGKRTILAHIGVSLSRVLVGFSLASVCGVLVGVLIGRSKTAEAIIRPLFELIRPIPGVAWIPMAILWFGIGEQAKYFIIFIGGFSHIVVNTYSGSKRVDSQLMGVAYMLGATERDTFFNVVIPSIIPYIFAGLQVGLSTSWMAVLAAEMVSSREGAGWVITAAMENGDMTQILVGVIMIAVVGLLLATIMRISERLLCSWRVKGT